MNKFKNQQYSSKTNTDTNCNVQNASLAVTGRRTSTMDHVIYQSNHTSNRQATADRSFGKNNSTTHPSRSRRATALFQPNKKPAAVPSSAIKGNGKSGLSRSSNKGADAGAVSSNKCTVLDNPNPIPNPIPVRPFNRSELVLGINLQRRAIFAFNTKRVRRR